MFLEGEWQGGATSHPAAALGLFVAALALAPNGASRLRPFFLQNNFSAIESQGKPGRQ